MINPSLGADYAKSIHDLYFCWKASIAYPDEIVRARYSKLLYLLDDCAYTWSKDIPMDENRMVDGLDLRDRFSYVFGISRNDITYALSTVPCTILDVMVSLSIKIEEEFMSDGYSDKTTQWFQDMISSLGLTNMTDDNYDENYIMGVLLCFLNRQYEPNGAGGLFTVKNGYDLRRYEIWYQLNWYVSEKLNRRN